MAATSVVMVVVDGSVLSFTAQGFAQLVEHHINSMVVGPCFFWGVCCTFVLWLSERKVSTSHCFHIDVQCLRLLRRSRAGKPPPSLMLCGQSIIALYCNYAIVFDDSLQYTWNHCDYRGHRKISRAYI